MRGRSAQPRRRADRALFHVACSYGAVPRHHQRGHHASYTLTFAAMAVGGSVVRATQCGARGGRVGAVQPGLAVRMAADVPTLPGDAGSPLALRAALAAPAGLDRPLSRRDARPTALVAAFWRGHDGAAGPFELIWTGKAVDSGWSASAGRSRQHVERDRRLFPGNGRHQCRFSCRAGTSGAPWPAVIARDRPVSLPCCGASATMRGARAGRGVRRHFHRRTVFNPLFPAARSADADQTSWAG